jgi:hypothetical protein
MHQQSEGQFFASSGDVLSMHAYPSPPGLGALQQLLNFCFPFLLCPGGSRPERRRNNQVRSSITTSITGLEAVTLF